MKSRHRLPGPPCQRTPRSLDAGPAFREVIIDERNQIVVDEVKAIVEGDRGVGSIAILYGAAHMPDMGERLADQLGYGPTGEQWLSAIEVDLTESAVSAEQLQTFRRMMRQQLRLMKSAP